MLPAIGEVEYKIKKMENLEIISSHQTIQARQIIEGNTANFSWSFIEGETPNAVNFNVQRSVVGNPAYTGNMIITGAYYAQSEKFDVQNNNYCEGDMELYQGILTTCKEIITPTPEPQ